MRINYLFSSTTFVDYSDSVKRVLGSKIERLTDRQFQLNSVEIVSDDFYQEFSMKVPVMQIDEVFQRKPVDVKIEMEPEYYGRSSQKIDGTRFEIILPYKGKSELFAIRPTVYNSDPPYGEVELDGVHFIYEIQVFHDQNAVRKNFDQNFANLQLWLGNLKKDVDEFNISLKEEIHSAVKYRRGKVAKDAAAANLLGFPIK